MANHNTGMPVPQVLEPGGQPCCESGRPVMTEPLTGQTLCSCKYESQLLSFHRLAAAGLPAYGSTTQYPSDAVLPIGADPSAAFFPQTLPQNAFDIKDNLDTWRMLPYTSLYYPYDASAFSGYPFAAGYAIDINGARRKNATRETTSTLKAWLNEHRKNPYPTKGEKIMLAIITKMTLTQVSTWFANARRRLKKENKMTWEPRNRCDEDDDDLDADDDDLSDEKDKTKGNGDHESEDDEKKPESFRVRSVTDVGKVINEGSKLLNRQPVSPKSPGTQDIQRLTNLSPSGSPSMIPDLSGGEKNEHCSSSLQSKPRIWSIADMATSKLTKTEDLRNFVSVNTNHPTLIPQGGLSANFHSGSGVLPPMITSNWYAPPSATPHLASHRHHPHLFTSPVATHPAFHGVTSLASSCSSAVSVFNDSVAVASSLTRLRTAAAAATAPVFRSRVNDSISQRTTSPPSPRNGGAAHLSQREISKNEDNHNFSSTSENAKVS